MDLTIASKIRQEYLSGIKSYQTCKTYGISKYTYYRIINNELYHDEKYKKPESLSADIAKVLSHYIKYKELEEDLDENPKSIRSAVARIIEKAQRPTSKDKKVKHTTTKKKRTRAQIIQDILSRTDDYNKGGN